MDDGIRQPRKVQLGCARRKMLVGYRGGPTFDTAPVPHLAARLGPRCNSTSGYEPPRTAAGRERKNSAPGEKERKLDSLMSGQRAACASSSLWTPFSWTTFRAMCLKLVERAVRKKRKRPPSSTAGIDTGERSPPASQHSLSKRKGARALCQDADQSQDADWERCDRLFLQLLFIFAWIGGKCRR